MSDGSIKIDTKVDVEEALQALKRLDKKLTETESVAEKSSSGFSKIGSAISTLGKTALVGLGAVTTGVIAIGKSALESYADYEQLVGGVDTLFKDSSKKVQEYSKMAYATANLSANEYMETITGFSASLIASLEGDTEKACEVGNRAIIDMSDNANKMGTSMESLQNAYSGFAKQNYTMLDNLKLGYGGTKEEMARLISDTAQMTDIQDKLNIKVNEGDMSFGNIINAISVMQEKLGITGATANESATTISGSINAMKSAWANLVTDMANKDADLSTSINNVATTITQVAKNIGKIIPDILRGISVAITSLVKEILPEALEQIPTLLKELLPVVKDLFVSIINTIEEAIPQLMEVAKDIIPMLIEAICELMPMLLELGIEQMLTICEGLVEAIPNLITTMIDAIIKMCDSILNNLDRFIDVAVDIIMAIVDGLVQALPTLIAEVPRIINTFCDKLYSLLPTILKLGVDIIVEIAKGLWDSRDVIIDNFWEILKAVFNVVTLINWTNLGKDVIKWIKDGVKSLGDDIPKALTEIGKNALKWLKDTFMGGYSTGSGLISNIVSGISNVVSNLWSVISKVGGGALKKLGEYFTPTKMVTIGASLIEGIWDGIWSMSSWLVNKISNFADSVVDTFCELFKINSPSKVMRDRVGISLPEGIVAGMDKGLPQAKRDLGTDVNELIRSMEGAVDCETALTTAKVIQHNNIMSSNDSTDRYNNNITVVAKLEVDGKEFTQTVVAPNQSILEEYNIGR